MSILWRRKALAAAVACAFAAGQIQANGVGPTVVAGQASFSTAGNSLVITNSPGAIINWQGFSIGASETTRFIQQSAASSILNRVIGTDPSIILGTLTSNGRVFLINPSGILFGQGARIDVAGLVASTLNLSNQDFLAGRLNFTPNPLAGRVENQGSITTPTGGSVYLVGANVTNSGIISSPQGDVILAAGQSVKILDTSTPGVRVELTASDNTAVNLGQILAQSGQVGIYGAALRNAGIIDADQVVRDASGKIVLRAKQDVTLDAGSRLSASGEQGGEIRVQAETGTALVSGAIDAKGTGAGQTGGMVQVLGDKVGLFDRARINVSGDAGGGLVLIGGNFYGGGPEQNAQSTSLDGSVIINADAINSGNGGRIAVWSDGDTSIGGTLTARGGATSGDGGLIETSGKQVLLSDRTIVNTLAPHGKTGLWLFDPDNWKIAITGGDETPTSVTTSLATTNRLIAALIDITVADDVTWTTPQTLTLNAGHDVLVNAAMNASTAGSGIVLQAGNDVKVTGALTASASGSVIDMRAGNNVSVATVTADAGGSVNLRANNDVIVNGMISADGGTVNLRADNDGSRAGKVTFAASGGATAVTTNIYYNPTSYANYVTDNTYYRTKVVAGALNTYMLLFVDGLNANKTYDGNTTAGLIGTATIAPAGGDSVTLAGSASVTNFSNKDVHTEVLTLSGYSIIGGAAYKYSLFQPSSLTATITPKTITLSASKTYDGTTGLTGAVSLATGISGEALNYTGATASDAHVATANKFIDAITLADGTGLAGNYQLPALNVANAPVTISAATLTPTLTNAGVTKIYDGGTTAPVGFSPSYSYAGLVSGDTAATLANTGAAYNDKNVADATQVTVSGLSISAITGGNSSAASDYVLDVGSKSVAASITAKPLTISGFASDDKIYNRLTTAVISSAGTLTGVEAGDTVGFSHSGATFDTKDVGVGKTVTLNGVTLTGVGDQANYSYTAPTTDLSSITPATLTVNADAVSKTYGTFDPVLTYSTGALQFGDSAASVLSGTLSRAPGETVGAYAIARNTLASNANYIVVYTGNNLSIAPAVLNVVANPQTKAFGAADPALSFSVTGLVNNPLLGIADTAAGVLSGALVRAPGETAAGGPYAITKGSLATSSNYALGFTGSSFVIVGAATEPVFGLNVGQLIFAGVVNNQTYYRPGNFWHVSLNSGNADPGFDVMRGTSDANSRARRRMNSCDSVFGGGFCETWSFPQQRTRGDK